MFFICHVITISKCHVALWVGSPHPKSTSQLSLGSIGLMELEIMVFVISVPISNSIPMPRFQCIGLQMPKKIVVLNRISKKNWNNDI